MTSGIYELTFKNGSNYIGQSIDIENRWKQHADKLLKGTAAIKMQSAYDAYGFPDAEVIFECHKDYLDIMETYFIHQNPNSLNGSIPKLDPKVDYVLLLSNPGLLKHSCVSIISQAIESMRDISSMEAKLEGIKANLEEVLSNYNDEYMLAQAAVELAKGKDENAFLVDEYDKQLREACQLINKLKGRTLWQRIWNEYD